MTQGLATASSAACLGCENKANRRRTECSGSNCTEDKKGILCTYLNSKYSKSVKLFGGEESARIGDADGKMLISI
jgi:hypothetical protein